MKPSSLAAFAAFLTLLLVSACNTMHGFGQDVEKTGDHIQNSSEKHN